VKKQLLEAEKRAKDADERIEKEVEQARKESKSDWEKRWLGACGSPAVKTKQS